MASKDVAAFLSQSPAFRRAPRFMESDPSHWFYLVRTGHVKIVPHSRTGKDVVLELLGPGEVFGGGAVCSHSPIVDEGERFILGDLNGLRALAEGEAS